MTTDPDTQRVEAFRMPLGEHLGELRSRLIRCLVVANWLQVFMERADAEQRRDAGLEPPPEAKDDDDDD